MERPVINTPVYTGWLTKQGDSIKTWKKRWFVLTKDFRLSYYKSPEDSEAIGSVPMPSYVIRPTNEVNKPFAFKASHAGMRTYFFVAESEQHMNSWVTALTLAANCELPVHDDSARASARYSNTLPEVCKAVVVKTYVPNAYDREALPLTEGETISVLEKNLGGWWKGMNSEQQVGTFPHTCVEEISTSGRNSNNPETPSAPTSQESLQSKSSPEPTSPTESSKATSSQQSTQEESGEGNDSPQPPKKPPRGDTIEFGKLKTKSGKRPSWHDAFPAAVPPTEGASAAVASPPVTAPPVTAPAAAAVAPKETKTGSLALAGTPALALFPYIASSPNELSFAKDETIFITDTEGPGLGSGWWYGLNEMGTPGFIPTDYVKILS